MHIIQGIDIHIYIYIYNDQAAQICALLSEKVPHKYKYIGL